MGRSIVILSMGFLLGAAGGGCASKRAACPSEPVAPTPASAVHGSPIATSALVFTPPVAFGVADEMDLDRSDRVVAAVGGFETEVISETWVRQDDRFRQGRFGDQSFFERRSISTSITVRRR